MVNAILVAMGVAFAPMALEPRAAAPEPAPTAAPAQVDNKRYCIVDPTTTGTRLPKRVCHSRSDWLKEGVDPLKRQ